MTSLFKNKYLKTLLLAGVATGIMVASEAKAQDSSFSDSQKTEIENIFKNYLLTNPEILAEAMNELRAKQEREAQKRAEEKIAEYKSDFMSDKFPVVGDKDGDVMVVEFYDYNCGYCKRALPDIQALLEKDENVRVVLVNMPILGPASLLASKWALAAHKQGKYFEYHTALMQHRGSKTEESLSKIGGDLGLDIDQLKTDANSDDIQKQINENVRIARDLGVQGTPAFIVDDELYRGYIGEEALISRVEEARKN